MTKRERLIQSLADWKSIKKEAQSQEEDWTVDECNRQITIRLRKLCLLDKEEGVSL